MEFQNPESIDTFIIRAMRFLLAAALLAAPVFAPPAHADDACTYAANNPELHALCENGRWINNCEETQSATSCLTQWMTCTQTHGADYCRQQ